MGSKGTLLERQRRWAETARISVDPRGYVSELEKNLFRPLTQKVREALEKGDGGETRDQAERPAKMRALHSSSSLAANVFDYWTDRNRVPLANSLQLGDSISDLLFEKKFPTGLPGNAPNLDVVLTLAGGHIVGVESKFTEWMSPKAKNYVPFRDAYFPGKPGLWADLNLPKCQELAEAMFTGRQRFRHLDSAQLLKHALGLATHSQGRFSLLYVYFDWPCPAREPHLLELDSFSALVGAEIGFRPLSYQALYEKLLGELHPEDAPYRDYLRNRYFSGTFN